jgi:hypothetical protein
MGVPTAQVSATLVQPWKSMTGSAAASTVGVRSCDRSHAPPITKTLSATAAPASKGVRNRFIRGYLLQQTWWLTA